MAKSRRSRSRAGLLPGECRRRSLVVVERVSRPTQGEEGLTTFHNYIVSTRRVEGQWTHTVEYQGQIWAIPGKVVERLLAHRGSVIKEERSRRAKERILIQAGAVVVGAQGQ